jgi:hypothetical protein
LPAIKYGDQTRFAFRSGVTCLTTPTGAVLLNPPRSEKLSRLTAGQLNALKALNLRPATLSELCRTSPGTEIGILMNRRAACGWLTVTVRDGEPLPLAIAKPANHVPGGQPLQTARTAIVLARSS